MKDEGSISVVDIKKREPVVKYEDGYLVFAFINRGGERIWHYDLAEENFISRRKLISQIYNLSQKEGWITPQHIREMIEISHRLVKKDPYTGASI